MPLLGSFRWRVAASSLGLCLSALSAFAGIKVDISNSGRQLAEGLDPAYLPWATDYAWFTGGDTTSATFGSIAITFARSGPNGTGLKPGYWKTGVQSTTFNVKLTADGIKVDGIDTTSLGAAIEMRISGLTPGPHTLLLYLNNWDSPTIPAPPLDLFVDGVQVIDNLPVTSQVTNNANATTAYLGLNAVAGQPCVVLIRAETSGTETSKNVHINGFEIDEPNAKAQAISPSPTSGDEHANGDSGSLTLSWGSAILGAVSHHVYFGTNAAAVDAATPSSPEFRGNQTATSYALTGLNPHTHYYWRIDEVGSAGAITKGNLWNFRVRRLAFPGAEGYGRYARGGRGGVVVRVTNLNDSGPGSLRDAIEGDYGPRTVVFDVSGLITLQSDIILGDSRPYITIAGQTAPGLGICIKREQFAMSGADDVVMRFIRGLVGKESGATQNATGMAGVNHCIMDHCSFGWGIDEGLSTRGGLNLTFQRCSLSEALNVAGHQNYPAGTAHGYAASIGGDVASFHHNLLAHNEGRNWSMAGGLDGSGYYAGRLDIFNNVVYNWGGRTTDGGAHEVNFVSNYYKRGASTSKLTILNPQYGGFPGTQRYYMAGNVMPGRFDESNQALGLSIGTESGGTLPENSTPPYTAMSATPFFPSYATIHTATNAYKQVLSDSGCNLPRQDLRDARIANETLNGTYTYTGSVSGKRGLPDTTADVGGWENYGSEVRPADWDIDGDGMPRWWETLHGFNPASAPGDFTEANADPDGDGYTQLEDYLNWLALPNFECAAGSSIDVDLQALSLGYSKTSPVYTFGATSGGTVSLVSSRYARFTPSSSAAALAQFTYTVTDSAGDSMTRTVNLRVLGAPAVPNVSIEATDATASEFGTDSTVVFTLTRSGDTTAAINIALGTAGTATSGNDYSGLPASVSFAANQTTALVTLTALADDLSEGEESITLTVLPDAAYTVGDPASASATLSDQPAQQHFFVTIPDPAQRGKLDDPDNDGLGNFVEYFLGSSPAAPGPQRPALNDRGNGAFDFTYTRARNRPDVAGALQWSADLATWRNGGASDGVRTVDFAETVVSEPGADPESIQAAIQISGPAPVQLFLRLRVE